MKNFGRKSNSITLIKHDSRSTHSRRPLWSINALDVFCDEELPLKYLDQRRNTIGKCKKRKWAKELQRVFHRRRWAETFSVGPTNEYLIPKGFLITSIFFYSTGIKLSC